MKRIAYATLKKRDAHAIANHAFERLAKSLNGRDASARVGSGGNIAIGEAAPPGPAAKASA
jgi:hypothetical protein